MLTPRKYLSFSQMALFEMNPQKYISQYIYGEKQRITRNMQYGTIMADALENDELSGDPMLDIMMTKIPKFELRDKAFEVDLKDGKKTIRILCKPDTMKADMTAFKEYKSSTRAWTQKMADDSGQITFYSTGMWLSTGKIPQDIELVCVVVKYNEDGSLTPTGEIVRYRTQRSMVDIIKMCSRMKRAWAGINKLCESELL